MLAEKIAKEREQYLDEQDALKRERMAKFEAMKGTDLGDKTWDVAVETDHPIDVNIQTDPLTEEQEKELNKKDKETQFEKVRLNELGKNDPK